MGIGIEAQYSSVHEQVKMRFTEDNIMFLDRKANKQTALVHSTSTCTAHVQCAPIRTCTQGKQQCNHTRNNRNANTFLT